LRTVWKNVLAIKQNAKDTKIARSVLNITQNHYLDVREITSANPKSQSRVKPRSKQISVNGF
jgi:hypothetical protein